MSTPTGKPIDHFADVPHDTHERASFEHPPVENDSEPNRPAQAPARAQERETVERYEENGPDPLRSPYPDFDGPLQFASPHSQQHEQPATARPEASIRDLKRLEAGLRWIEREEEAARIRGAARLPPAPGVAHVSARGVRHRGDMLGFSPPRPLEPERMAPPPAMSSPGYKIRAPLIIVIASTFAAPIGYYLSTEGWNPFLQPAPGPQMVSPISKTNALPRSLAQQERQVMARNDDRGMLAQDEVSSQRPETSQPQRSSEGGTVAMLQLSSTGEQAPGSNNAIRLLDPEEIKLLMRQGEELIAAGDVVTARVVLQRAAEAGNASAAMALGATYDPNVLVKLGVMGVSPDAEKARSWYEKAETLGSPPPQVLIYRSATGYEMKVESTSQAARAERRNDLR
jgi:hypothetical protein